MDAALVDAIGKGKLQGAHQVLVGDSSSGSLSEIVPRLDETKLPLVDITDPAFFDSITGSARPRTLHIVHAGDRTAAKLLMTPMRDARLSGPALRDHHRLVGRYLATELVSDLVGLDECAIPHVQGHDTTGYRLRHEPETAVVAIMRAGEPMAFGVSDAFPLASFIHADEPEDIGVDELRRLRNVILVDSVINSGKTIVEFVRHIRALHPTVYIVVVAGVVQAGFVSNGTLQSDENLSIVALRLSDNKYTGKGGTDTGNRLFTTTHLR
jgi:uracil phosphoribosyltransferase